MKEQIKLTAAVLLFSAALNVDAALLSRLDGQAYYDTVLDITWLADANYARTSGYDSDGNMTWSQSMAWVAQLEVSGISNWRLPTTLQPDASCSVQDSLGSEGYYCSGSEMGNLFLVTLGNAPLYDVAGNYGQPGWGLSNSGPFSNIQASGSSLYWSETELFSPDSGYVFTFRFDYGSQQTNDKNGPLYYPEQYFAWAVHDGDVGALTTVPVPASIWLLGSGLLGLIGVAKRKVS